MEILVGKLDEPCDAVYIERKKISAKCYHPNDEEAVDMNSEVAVDNGDLHITFRCPECKKESYVYVETVVDKE